MRGTVVRYNEFRGYGFIKGDDERDYFVHWSFIEGAGYKVLSIGDIVEFLPHEVAKGLQAENVKIINSKIYKSLRLKPNPFTPQQPMIDPHKFAGRDEPIINALDCLFNHKNILITGERGIGKSSLAFQLSFLAAGETILLERHDVDTGGYVFSYLTPDHRCIPGHNINNIVESLILSAIRNLGFNLDHEKITTEFGIDLRFIKAIHKSESQYLHSNELVSYFVDSIERIWCKIGDKYNGLCFLIDEIDCLDQNENLSAFLKATIESLQFKNYRNVSFILAGVTGVITELLVQHKSFSRLFENIELRRMTESELAEVIGKALAESKVRIDPEIKMRIIQLSDRFPEPIHLLGYHCFRYDDDNNIDENDYSRALNFIIRELKRQEFDNLLVISTSGLGHSVLQKIAYYSKKSFTLSEIATELKEEEQILSGVFGDLVRKSIIVREKGRFFRLKDPLFRIYLKWVIGKDSIA